jgi:hypothetical protein
MTENLNRAPSRSRKATLMHRFTFLAGIALLCVPANAAKRKPPTISVCFDKVCLDRLRWARPEVSSLPSISGLLVNNSNVTLSTISLQFNLISGRVLTGTASALFLGQIPPGASWFFNACFSEYEGNRFVTRTESGSFAGVVTDSVAPRHLSLPLKFDPVFNSWFRQERKEWELLHGKRDQ